MEDQYAELLFHITKKFSFQKKFVKHKKKHEDETHPQKKSKQQELPVRGLGC